MPYTSRLIHRAAVHRYATARSTTGQIKPTYAAVSGLESVKCLLIQSDAERVQKMFGATIEATALVEFKYGIDLRPDIENSDGKNDKLVITDERGIVTTWLVVATRDPASARKMIVAAVTRAAL